MLEETAEKDIEELAELIWQSVQKCDKNCTECKYQKEIKYNKIKANCISILVAENLVGYVDIKR